MIVEPDRDLPFEYLGDRFQKYYDAKGGQVRVCGFAGFGEDDPISGFEKLWVGPVLN